MDEWKQSFTEKLGHVQASYMARFDETLDKHVMPVFEDLSAFLAENGFRTSVPLSEAGRRSFKFELAEDAYLLIIFRSAELGALEMSCESVVPGGEPTSRKRAVRIPDVNAGWSRKVFQNALDGFVDRLSGHQSPANKQAEAVPA